MFPLFTRRLVLRRFAAHDLTAFHAYRNEPGPARFQSWEAIGLTDAAEFIKEHQIRKAGVPGQWLQIAVALRETETLIGDCAFKVHADDIRHATIGGTLARKYHRQGYGFEGMTCLLHCLFENLNLHRVVADTDPENKASWVLMERLGLRREGHLKKSLWFKGRWADEYLYAILRDEWQGDASPTKRPILKLDR